jgi:aspartyl-tRNA(Asn)/glutamyl-tRNA(Gln) amidotransferase subunit A
MGQEAAISGAIDAQRAGRETATSLTRRALERAGEGAVLNAFAYLDQAGAMEAAAACDRDMAAGRVRGPLHGIPISIKDLFNVAGMPTRAGTTAALPDLNPPEAPAVIRLRQAGAIILGKTNMHEVALGVTGENPWSGSVLNPRARDRQAGGSSSGAAVAVATGMGLASLGTDTGGSIRIPAALCGVAGFKGTHGLVPLDGALALSPTCDHAGPFAASVADLRIVTEVLASADLSAPSIPARLRFGVPRHYLAGWLSEPVRAAFERLLDLLGAQGHEVVDVAPRDLEGAPVAYTPLVRAEAAFVHRKALAAGGEGFSEVTRAALLAGAALPVGEYLEARRLRDLVIAGLEEVLADLDALLLPAAPVVAPLLGTADVSLQSGGAPHRAAFLHLTTPFSLAGVPVAAIPLATFQGLPIGVQVVGPRGRDAQVLAVAEEVERLVAAEEPLDAAPTA